MATSVITNKEISQDRAYDLWDTYNKYGYVMFPQQRRIYSHIANCVKGKSVFEAGCGNGVGTALLARTAFSVTATDKSAYNIQFAKCLYPWIEFYEWDMCQPYLDNPYVKAAVVVCIEAFEHVADAAAALKNLLDLARDEVWFSTPNGTGKPKPPSNPYHVYEYTPEEVFEMIPHGMSTEILECEYFKPCDVSTQCDPLLYRIKL